MADQPTIMVKKSDGTFIRVPVSDLPKYKKPAAAAPAQASKINTAPAPKPIQTMPVKPVQPKPAAIEPKKMIPPVSSPTPAKPAPAPVRPLQPSAKVNLPRPPLKKEQVKLTSADFASLLEDGDMESSLDMPKTSLSRVAEADEVIKKIKFFISPENLIKLRQIIQVFLKDVRSENETRELLAKSRGQGGLSMEQPQIEEVIKLCREFLGRPVKEIPVSPLKKIPSAPLQTLPKKFEAPGEPATAAPFNSSVHAPLSGQKPATRAPEKSYQIKPTLEKVKMQDVVSHAVEMGPVEEIGNLTLTDFRRLSADPAEAASRLKQKFVNLRDESYVLYLQALEAWQKSPLCAAYLSAPERSLIEKKKISDVLVDKNNLTVAELSALARMFQTL